MADRLTSQALRVTGSILDWLDALPDGSAVGYLAPDHGHRRDRIFGSDPRWKGS